MVAIMTCCDCGAEIPPDTQGGHCPKCLLSIGLSGAAESPASPEPPPAGEVRSYGDYELLELLGRGGMGVVYKARQKSLNRLVALKLVQHWQDVSPTALMRFRLEAEAAAKLDHPNIVPTYQVGEEDSQPFFSMKLVSGASLAKKFSDLALGQPPGKGAAPAVRRPVHEAQMRIATLVAKVARAVHYAHLHGVIHRDLKPTNILLDVEGEPHLTDFGIAKMLEKDSGLTRTNDVLGTPSYMAPEQASGQAISPAVDVYSLGAILYELLTSRPPFRGETPLETLRKLAQDEPVPPTKVNRDVNVDLACICLKCLEKHPMQRYASALALAHDLERWMRNEPIAARRLGPLGRTMRWTRRNPLAASLILSLCFGLAVSIALLRMVIAQKTKTNQVLGEVSKREQENAQLVGLTVAMLRAELEGMWLSNERRVLAIRSEQLAVLSGLPFVEVPKRVPCERYAFGLSANESPTSDALRYAPLLSHLETQMSLRRGKPVRFDLHIFKRKEDRNLALVSNGVALARSGLQYTNGLDFARMGNFIFLQLEQEHPELKALVQPVVASRVGTFFTRPGTGINSLADLKGRKVLFGDYAAGISFSAVKKLVDVGLAAKDLGDYGFIDSRTEFLEEIQENGLEAVLARRKWLDSTADVIEDVLSMKAEVGVTSERGFLKNQSQGLVQIPDSEFVRPAAPWVASPTLPADVARDMIAVMTALRDEGFLTQLPESPLGYKVVTEATLEADRKIARRVTELFPFRPAATNQTNSAMGNAGKLK